MIAITGLVELDTPCVIAAVQLWAIRLGWLVASRSARVFTRNLRASTVATWAVQLPE